MSMLFCLCLLSASCTSAFYLPTPVKSRRIERSKVVISEQVKTQLSSSSSSPSSLQQPRADFDMASAYQQTSSLLTGSTLATTTTSLKTRSSNSNSPSLTYIWQLAVAGALATLVGDTLMHPVDCIKTLQQSDEGFGLNFGQAAQVIFYKNHGLSGFYRGLGTYLVCDGTGGAIKFAAYEYLKSLWGLEGDDENNVNQQSVDDDGLQKSISLFMAAGIAFLVSSVVLVPGEFLKQQMQMIPEYNTPGAAMTGIYAAGGFGAFFTGYDGVCLRDIPYTMIELGLYDWIKNNIFANNDNDEQQSSNWQLEVGAAGLTGAIAGFCTTPLDTIKTKLMVDHYSSFVDAFAATYDSGGLFCGAAARVAWLLPLTAIYLPLFDLMKRQINIWRQGKDGQPIQG